jgi:hypothetical protein
MRAWGAVIAVVLLVSAWPAAAEAQLWRGSDAPRPGSVEITGGVISFAGFDLGNRNAAETRNINTGADPFTLFAAGSRIGGAPGAQFRVGVYLAKAVSLESSVQYGRPKLSIRLSNDAEQAPGVTADDTITRYVADGSVLFHLTHLSFAGGRAVPFISGGAGYIRELHDANEFVQTGHEYHAGAGLHVWFGEGTHRLGFRADVGASMRDGGADFGTGSRTDPTGGASIAYLF